METSIIEKSGVRCEEQSATGLASFEEPIAEKQLSGQSSESFNDSDDPNVVVFDGLTDPEDPQNWPTRYKYVLVALLSSMCTMV